MSTDRKEIKNFFKLPSATSSICKLLCAIGRLKNKGKVNKM